MSVSHASTERPPEVQSTARNRISHDEATAGMRAAHSQSEILGSTTMETTSTSSIHTAMPTLKGKRVFITGARPGAGAPSLIFSDQ